MVQIYKPNIDVIRQQAQHAREQEQKRKEEDGLRFLNIDEGDNVLRLLPPTNSRGLIFKRVSNHYFRDTPFQGKLNKQRCIVQTHDDVPHAQCPICDIGDRILAQRPDMKIDRWHRPGIGYFGQAVSRADQDPISLAQIVRVTPGVKNWITQQVEQAWGQGIDMTDLQAGLDINIVKGEKQTKNGKRTEYKPSISSLMGPTPVVTSVPEGYTLDQAINKIVESMYDLDQIWKFPDDEGMAELNKAAADIYSYYTKQGYSQPGAQVQVPGTLQSATPQPQHQQPAQAQPQYQQPVQPQQPQYQTPPQQPQQPPVQQQPQYQQPPVQQQSSSPQQVASQAASIAQQPQQQPPQQVPSPAPSAQAAPTDRPACWGGAAPREDGGTGYNDDVETCLMCPHELTCLEACRSAGII